MNRFKEFFLKYSSNSKTLMFFTCFAFCFTIFLIFLLFKMAHDQNSPEFKYYDYYLVFNLMFLSEFLYLVFRNYDLKNSFAYSLISNYLIYSFYLLLNELTIYFCNNLGDAKNCLCDGAWLAISFRIYIVRSTWLEYLLYFLILSGLSKIIIFKILYSPKIKKFIIDFFIINFTFLIIYFSFSKNYFILHSAINSYYKNNMYSSDYYKMLRKHYNVKDTPKIYDPYNLQWPTIDIVNEDERLYTKPTNLLTRILDCFVITN